MLSALSNDGLGLPRPLRHLDGGCELGFALQPDLLYLSSFIMGILACRKDQPPLPEHLSYSRHLAYECR